MKVDKGTVWMERRLRDISPDTHYPAWTAGTPALLSDGRMLLPYSGPQSAHSPVGTTRVLCRITDDLGETWGPEREVTYHPECNACGPCAFTAQDGTIRIFHMGFYASVWQDGEPDFERTRSDLWCVESRDNAETWTNSRMVFRGYTGATNGAIQTSSGALLVPFSYDVPNPGRLVSVCVVSEDNGETWKLGKAIDIGGAGDHDGALEPTVVELRDGRVWMLIRTTRGYLWEAFSSDNGLSWTDAKPSKIPSISAPGHILRLKSGRLALAWNNTTGTSKRRDALSIAFSEDDGETWTSPLICAKAKQVSYPALAEPRPGLIWIVAHNVNAGWRNTAAVVMAAAEEELLGG